MARKRAKIFETKYFGFIIGLFVFLVIFLLDISTSIFTNLNTKATDLQFFLKGLTTATSVQEGVTVTEKNPKISDDIIIVGIDSRSLAKFGKWPFPRSIHASLIDSFTRIKDQGSRESSIFLDVFFIESDRKAAEDARLIASIEQAQTVFIETLLDVGISDYSSHEIMLKRQAVLFERFPGFKNVSGSWQEMRDFMSVQAPLIPYSKVVAGYGHANYVQDVDQIYRRQALITKLSTEIEQIPFKNLQIGFTVDQSQYERLVWYDTKGFVHNIITPITKETLARLEKELATSSPPVIIDTDGDGNPDEQYYLVRKIKDYFVPAITLSLACRYFGVDPSELTVEIGKHIIIHNPTVRDAKTGQRIPYSIPVGKDQFDKDGNLVKAAPRKVLSEIKIPINENGEMVINYMGYRSSTALDGYRTFPVRSYASYAERAPGPNPETWPKTKAVDNKILMVGPFADGIAQDEKPTPYGLMYGIEIHANALNTILMNNFLIPAPKWVEYIILLTFILIICFYTSRYSTLWGFVSVLIGLIILFLGISIIFERNNVVIDFPKPAIAMLLSFVAVVSYRAMTEERDKKMIRATFGKYVSPKVVDQILENPPELGGVDKELTVLFSDIRGFTTLSENMTPQELVNHLNVYLTAMTDLILEYGGTLDKYVGDEIMCFWGAPLPQEDHAILACKCALRQMEKLQELNEQWPEHKRINIGIGLNSGIMTVGNMGSPGRMNYTLMGDNVNLGARLEGTNKQYGTGIIISEFTYGLVKDHFIVRELDNIRVKGKNKPVLIYELIDSIDSLDPPALETGKGKKGRG
ncbi:adenylate/guanylate cyclase domain-containing protein [Gracilinema caldarium]|uniref:Adenylate/guanylate cyclase with Chase sensor n=1 Tax=Gracilinema caldarium (strain ATCC 51460 / DSM 7334 / H1) TaxID=744872 RepID=F8F3F2_GRAC1|nr:adenylate/guanylate cyclase domain-containing protein [Gracilinema caldarium]AEJ19528.1 adenylate/guanylate cyclase with Chase sensor [Gracilinema caldarium DSM 7334]